MRILDIYGVHEITVFEMERTAYGMKENEGRVISGCFVTEQTRLVRDSAGSEVTSTAQVAAPLGTDIDIESEPVVLLPSGRRARILSVQVADPNGLPLPGYVQINLA